MYEGINFFRGTGNFFNFQKLQSGKFDVLVTVYVVR